MIRFCTSLLIGLLMIALSFYSTCSAQESVVRLTSGEWPPYQSRNELKHHGVFSRIVTEAFAIQRVTVIYGFFPWTRSLIYAKRGLWDGSLAWAQDRSDFKDDFYFSDPILTVSKALFYLKTKPLKWERMEDLKGLTIGVTASYTYGEAFNRAKENGIFKVQKVTTDLQNIRKLLGGRLDAFAMGIDVALYLMQKNLQADEIHQITYHPKFLMEAPMCVIFPKRSENSLGLMTMLNKGLEKLRKDGIIEKYIKESRMGEYNNK